MQAWEEKYYEREEGREEGLKAGREENHQILLSKIQKKLGKGKTTEEIADELEEDVDTIQSLIKEFTNE